MMSKRFSIVPLAQFAQCLSLFTVLHYLFFIQCNKGTDLGIYA